MKRGDIVTIADPQAGDFAKKPRPALVVQTDAFLLDHASVTVCLITSHLTGLGMFRIPVAANSDTGLLKSSEVSIDKLQSVWRHRVGYQIGTASDETMFAVEQALRRWLAL
jgi:mRNA interferase MazF